MRVKRMKKVNELRRKLKNDEIVVGMVCCTFSPMIVEVLGYTGFDFVFFDTEHSTYGIDPQLENLVRAAEASGISTIVRIKENNESMIRNALETGIDMIIVPHIKTENDAVRAIQSAKFPPQGIRGASSIVRSARYQTQDFNWGQYITESNEDSLVQFVIEDKEAFDNLDGILDSGPDAVLFGPTDYGLSIDLPLLYILDNPEIQLARKKLIMAASERGIPVSCPVAPTTLETAKKLVDEGVQTLIFRNDVMNFGSICQQFNDDIINKIR
jgi:4-hydroxy-2-oxoheptanedioate aldolase